MYRNNQEPCTDNVTGVSLADNNNQLGGEPLKVPYARAWRRADMYKGSSGLIDGVVGGV